MSTNGSARCSDLLVALLAMGWLAGLRHLLGGSWGLSPSTSAELLTTGILYNPTDTWSYLSWVQQYAHGSSLAGLLYTTESHEALLWVFPLWLVGKIAVITGLPLVTTYNLAGLVGAGMAVFFFRRVCASLQLSHAANNGATLALLLSSGGSWIPFLIGKLNAGGTSSISGGEFFFLDFFPSTALLVYAYHAMGYALLTMLWWSATTLENDFVARSRALRPLAIVVCVGVLLGFSRPYEPLAFLGAWFFKTAWLASRWRQQPHDARASLLTLVVIALSLALGIGWSVWVSRQPLWSTFADEALALGLPCMAWLWTLAPLLAMSAFGAGPFLRRSPRHACLPVAATLLLMLVIFCLGRGHTKLASGLMLGPIILAGFGVERVVLFLKKTSAAPRLILSGGVLFGALGVPSLVLVLNHVRLSGPTVIDRNLVELANQIPMPLDNSTPQVLTDAETGNILPGLIGARVWAGHWSLTPHYEQRTRMLKTAGIDKAVSAQPASSREQMRMLQSLLSTTAFDYALLDRECTPVIEHLSVHHWSVMDHRGRWTLLKSPTVLP